MGAKGGKHVFNSKDDNEHEEVPLPGRKHLTRRLTDKAKNSSSFHRKENVGYRYNASETPEITEVKINGIQSVYWRVKWPKRTISFQENDNGEENKCKMDFKNLLDEDADTNEDVSDSEEQMTQRTVIGEPDETAKKEEKKADYKEPKKSITKVQSYTNESFKIDDHDDLDQNESDVIKVEPSSSIGNEHEDKMNGDEDPNDVEYEDNKLQEKYAFDQGMNELNGQQFRKNGYEITDVAVN